jgi:hypothetical protein
MLHMDFADPLLPAAGLVAVTAVVWVRLYVVRFSEMLARRIVPQSLATSRQAAETLQRTGAADNFKNLFEVPVLFYALCLAIAVSGADSRFLVAGSWVYVLLRAAHSAIHCTYNNVTHRFLVYASSTVLLFALWADLALRLGRVGVA